MNPQPRPMQRSSPNDPYGFMASPSAGIEAMPQRPAAVLLPLAGDISWFTTAMIPGARNHCAAVMVANLLAYASKRQGTSARISLEDIYERIGDGPILVAPRYAGHFLAEEGYRTKQQILLSKRQIAAALEHKMPCIFLLCASPRHWHWVLCVGYSRQEDGIMYVVADGWHSELRFLRIGTPSHLMWAVSVSLGF